MRPRTGSTRSEKPAGRPPRPAGFAILAALALVSAAAPLQPATAATSLQAAGDSISGSRQWVSPGDERAAIRLIAILQSADLDGLDPARFDVEELKAAVRAASEGDSPQAVTRANAMLDRALVGYATALRTAPASEWTIVDRGAVPPPPPAETLLAQASAAPSLAKWIEALPFMHPSYHALRRALGDAEDRGEEGAAALLRLNLARIRLLPAKGHYVLVNTAAQRLYMYEDGREVDSMRVVVGRPVHPTPMMAATIKFTALNPYWNVPADLAAERIAPNVVKQGISYLGEMGYIVYSDWGEQATRVDPATIDWQAVADGRQQVRIRQEPGPHNAMGRMKFMFPNAQGIYLHDTPDKKLLNEAARLFSGGCVRLEDAPRLAAWLYGRPLDPDGAGTEQPVPLDRPVPVYLAYLTAVPNGGEVVFYDDIYGKDRSQLAASGEELVAVR